MCCRGLWLATWTAYDLVIWVFLLSFLAGMLFFSGALLMYTAAVVPVSPDQTLYRLSFKQSLLINKKERPLHPLATSTADCFSSVSALSASPVPFWVSIISCCRQIITRSFQLTPRRRYRIYNPRTASKSAALLFLRYSYPSTDLTLSASTGADFHVGLQRPLQHLSNSWYRPLGRQLFLGNSYISKLNARFDWNLQIAISRCPFGTLHAKNIKIYSCFAFARPSDSNNLCQVEVICQFFIGTFDDSPSLMHDLYYAARRNFTSFGGFW